MKLTGYVNANLWNKEKRVFEIKTLGERDNGAILAGLSVSGKDKDGKTIYGQPVDMKISIKSADEGQRIYEMIADKDTPMVEFDGFFAPNNWTNKEGKEYRGHQIIVSDSTSFKVHNKEATATDDAPFDVEEPNQVPTKKKW